MNSEPDPNRKSWTGQALMVVAALTALLWFLQVRRAPVQFLERRDCEKAYAAAHTHADSLAVTCGSLRRSGRL